MKISIRTMLMLGVSVAAMFASRPAAAIPAFARKYGLPCSACHEAWPKLNNFGQVFKDNGYQLGNERDAPIYQKPEYFPITFRMTPQWHRETTNRTGVDATLGSIADGLVERKTTFSGFDMSGIDMWTAGTLAKNISFAVLPSSDQTGVFHFEAAWIRFDNLLDSRWLNLKFGKFELDTPVSEKRFLTLSQNGGFYQLYHFSPSNSELSPTLPFVQTDLNPVTGIGDNQLGIELAGHSRNSYTRYALSLLSSNDGTPGLPTNRSYDFYGHFSQAFELPRLGLQRVGAFAYVGKAPTYYLTSGGVPIPGGGAGDRSFYRAGAYGIWYAGRFDLSTLFMHGRDNVFLATGVPANQSSLLPIGARSPTWNGGFTELHFAVSPQFVAVARYELIRMSRQAFPAGTPLTNGQPLSDRFGDVNAYVVGYRWYPIMNSRAGLAWHQEYSLTDTSSTSPVTASNVRKGSYLMGFDLAF